MIKESGVIDIPYDVFKKTEEHRMDNDANRNTFIPNMITATSFLAGLKGKKLVGFAGKASFPALAAYSLYNMSKKSNGEKYRNMSEAEKEEHVYNKAISKNPNTTLDIALGISAADTLNRLKKNTVFKEKEKQKDSF